MRISLSDDLYWRLVRLAADQEMRYDALLEKWINEQEGHRDEKAKMPSCQNSQAADLPHDSSRPRKGTYSEEELDQIRTMYREGKGSRIIAQTMNRGRSGIIYAINAMKKRGEL